MLTIEQARRLTAAEPDVAELLREFEEVNRYYCEAVAAMSAPEQSVAPVLNSAEVTLSFESDAHFDLFRNDR